MGGGSGDQFEGRCHDKFALLTWQVVFKLRVIFYNCHIPILFVMKWHHQRLLGLQISQFAVQNIILNLWEGVKLGGASLGSHWHPVIRWGGGQAGDRGQVAGGQKEVVTVTNDGWPSDRWQVPWVVTADAWHNKSMIMFPRIFTLLDVAQTLGEYHTILLRIQWCNVLRHNRTYLLS